MYRTMYQLIALAAELPCRCVACVYTCLATSTPPAAQPSSHPAFNRKQIGSQKRRPRAASSARSLAAFSCGVSSAFFSGTCAYACASACACAPIWMCMYTHVHIHVRGDGHVHGACACARHLLGEREPAEDEHHVAERAPPASAGHASRGHAHMHAQVKVHPRPSMRPCACRRPAAGRAQVAPVVALDRAPSLIK